MKKCECYHENMRKAPRYDVFTGLYRGSVDEKYAVCWGTKECEECSCGGDKTKCSFYPEVRKKAKQEIAQKAKSKEHLALLEENEKLKKELEVTRAFICDNGLEFILANYAAKYNKGER